MTNPLGDFIAAHDNYKHCFGIIGSGNRNFNEQYCLTAKQYAKRFGFPMLGDFELRGTSADIERLAEIIRIHKKKVKLIQGDYESWMSHFLFSMITLSTLRRLGL